MNKIVAFILTMVFGFFAGAFTIQHNIKNKQDIRIPQPYTPDEYVVPAEFPAFEDVECLAQVTYHEARGESTAGKLGVMHVVINRVAEKHYGDSICAVVYYGKRDAKGRPIRGKCQFSWVCDGVSDEIKNYGEYQQLREMAYQFLVHRPVDITDGAKWFKTLSSKSRPWGDKAVQIDNHVFFK